MDAQTTGSPQHKDVSRWRERVWASLSWVTAVAGVAGVMFCCIAAAGTSDLAAVVLFVSICAAAVVVHEYGHVLGARAGGMVPWLVQTGPLQFQAVRGRWRWRCRFIRAPRLLSGFVMAFPDPRRAAFPQMLAIAAAGPAANLLIAILAVGFFVLSSSDEWRAALAAMAISNLAMGIVNLFPRRLQWESDGAQLLRILKTGSALDHSPLDQLNGLSVRGTTADALPPHLVDALASSGQPMPLMHLWFVLKAQQIRSDWQSVASMADSLESAIADVPAEMLPHVSELIASMRCEIEFSRILAGGGYCAAADRHLGREADWFIPWLRPRCQALAAARAGDLPQARRLLQISAEFADRSIDQAVHQSELRIRAGIEQVLDGAVPAG